MWTKEEYDMTGQELVAFAKSKLGVPYVYGMKGTILTESNYNNLKRMYGDLIWDSDRQKIGKICCDCSGLISWATGIVRSSQNYHDTALEIQPIATIAKAPIGVAVWRKGHIGIYIGGGSFVHASGEGSGTVGQYADQCVKTAPLSGYWERYVYNYRRLY